MMWVGTSYPRIHSTAEDKVGRPKSKHLKVSAEFYDSYLCGDTKVPTGTLNNTFSCLSAKSHCFYEALIMFKQFNPTEM